jgi:hypothetical protein
LKPSVELRKLAMAELSTHPHCDLLLAFGWLAGLVRCAEPFVEFGVVAGAPSAGFAQTRTGVYVTFNQSVFRKAAFAAARGYRFFRGDL